MIRPLRARHRAIFVALALLILPALAVALAARRPPAASALPEGLLAPGYGADLPWSAAVELAGTDLRARQARGVDGRIWIELAGAGPRKADVLLYIASEARSDGELPQGARLVGPLGTTSPVARRIELPPDASGWLVLYSLADGAALGAFELREE